MVIIAGHLVVDPADREDFLRDSVRAVELARRAPGCADYSLAADLLDPARVNVYERWDSPEQLMAFRGSGPDDTTAARIVGADVRRFVIAAVEEA